ncbi:N-formylglutamate amidohydrolase [Yoonia sp. BS5-3]|uniref:N-formylglutamate amidohydrolase n=1 Tax=Yoonia phaeophyticola TaxID=3137369 RepID=A0ABZ2V618_9RHOB
MEQQNQDSITRVSRQNGLSPVVLVCEHAAHHIPTELGTLGLSDEARFSHIAWDPGALGVARAMSEVLDATLVAASVSRLVYDCNRPPEAPDAMPAKSEAFEVPGNVALSDASRQARVSQYYEPFRKTLSGEIARKDKAVIVTIHSFTPIYHGAKRDVEIGILHDTDQRFADVLLDVADGFNVQRNAPYGPEDGVTHTLRLHAISHGHLNVMIEIRNDLIQTEAAQLAMGQKLADWVAQALQKTMADPCKR